MNNKINWCCYKHTYKKTRFRSKMFLHRFNFLIIISDDELIYMYTYSNTIYFILVAFLNELCQMIGHLRINFAVIRVFPLKIYLS